MFFEAVKRPCSSLTRDGVISAVGEQDRVFCHYVREGTGGLLNRVDLPRRARVDVTHIVIGAECADSQSLVVVALEGLSVSGESVANVTASDRVQSLWSSGVGLSGIKTFGVRSVVRSSADGLGIVLNSVEITGVHLPVARAVHHIEQSTCQNLVVRQALLLGRSKESSVGLEKAGTGGTGPVQSAASCGRNTLVVEVNYSLVEIGNTFDTPDLVNNGNSTKRGASQLIIVVRRVDIAIQHHTLGTVGKHFSQGRTK